MFVLKASLSRNCVGFIIGFVILQFACSKKSPAEPEPDLSEDRGLALTAKSEQVSGLDRLVWSADGQEVFYLSRQSGGNAWKVTAVKVSDKSTRVIDGSKSSYWLHGLSQDGNYLFFAASPSNGNPALFRAPTNGQAVERIVGEIAIVGSEPAVALSPNNVDIAYASLRGGADSLFVFNTANGTKRFYAMGLPIAFSPDGSQLLIGNRFPTYDSLYIVSLSNGSIQSLVSGLLSGNTNLWAIRWDSHGIRALLSGGAGTVIRIIITGATMPVSSENPSGGFVAWSADGNKFAYWATRCLKAGSVLTCAITEYNLNLIELNSNQTKRAAYGNNADAGSGGLNPMAFSPDGKKIAFVFSDQLYLKDL